MSRPANTVGGDFYDILPLRDGRVVIALGDVAGQRQPGGAADGAAAGDVAHARAVIEDENLEPSELATRLNVQVARHAPGNRFITLFCGVFTPLTGELRYVSAGHTPPLVLSAGGGTDRLADGGIALGMFDAVDLHSRGGRSSDLAICWPCTATGSPRPRTRPASRSTSAASKLPCKRLRGRPGGPRNGVVRAVEQHTGDVRFADDLTILLLRRSTVGSGLI